MKLNEEQIQKIKNFPWKENDSESEVPQPEYNFANEVFECVDAIYSYIQANLKTEHMITPHLFEIAIPTDVHRLLQEKYNPQWSDESRCLVFELIRGASVIALDSNRQELQKNLDNIMNHKPSRSVKEINKTREECGLSINTSIGKAQSSYVVEWSRLYDEPSCIIYGEEEGDKLIVEIGVKLVPLEEGI